MSGVLLRNKEVFYLFATPARFGHLDMHAYGGKLESVKLQK